MQEKRYPAFDKVINILKSGEVVYVLFINCIFDPIILKAHQNAACCLLPGQKQLVCYNRA